MNISEKRKLDVGEAVHWHDPDNELCSGHYFIQEIITESGRIEDEQTTLVLTDGRDSVAEVLAAEIA